MRIIRAGVLISAIGAVGSPALACSVGCLGGKMEPKNSFRRAAAVLIGTVETVEVGKQATLRVDELYKGRLSRAVTLDSGYGGDCRMYFEAGKQYLLFLYRQESKDRLVPEFLCEHSGEVGAESEAVRWVRGKKRLDLPSAEK